MKADELLKRLVDIDSVNPSLVPGAAGEREIAAFVTAWARDCGLAVKVLEATPGRPSVIVRTTRGGPGRRLMLCGHLDTVGFGQSIESYVDGDRLYGRGGYDMKAGLAAALIACRDANVESLAGEVVVACVADEEYASLGVQEALSVLSADAAIVCEPTESTIAVAHKGFVWTEIEVVGKEKTMIRGAERDLLRLNLTSESFEWALWVDDQDQFKLMKVAIPADNTEVIRD